MSAHTPGPWEVAEPDRNGQAIVRAAEYEVATCWHHCLGSIEKEMEANARLIAAAPELLVALKECRDAVAAAMRVIADIDTGKLLGMEPDTKYQRLIDECAAAGVSNGFGKRADAVIAKAEGR